MVRPCGSHRADQEWVRSLEERWFRARARRLNYRPEEWDFTPIIRRWFGSLVDAQDQGDGGRGGQRNVAVEAAAELPMQADLFRLRPLRQRE
jgi:hypothetical protein